MERVDEPDRAASPESEQVVARPTEAPPAVALAALPLRETALSTALLVPGVLLTVVGRIVVTIALTSAYVVASGPETSLAVLGRPWLLGLLAVVVAALAVVTLATRRPRVRALTGITVVTVLAAAIVVAFGPVLLRPLLDVHGTLLRADEESLGPLARPGWLLVAGALALALGAGVRHLAERRVTGAAPDEADVRCYERAVAASVVAVTSSHLLYPALLRVFAEVGVALPAVTALMLAVLDVGRRYLLGSLPLGDAVLDVPAIALALLFALLPAVPLVLARRSPWWRILAAVWMIGVTALACGLVLGVGVALVELANKL